jgi:hypothetical protein
MSLNSTVENIVRLLAVGYRRRLRHTAKNTALYAVVGLLLLTAYVAGVAAGVVIVAQHLGLAAALGLVVAASLGLAVLIGLMVWSGNRAERRMQQELAASREAVLRSVLLLLPALNMRSGMALFAALGLAWGFMSRPTKPEDDET